MHIICSPMLSLRISFHNHNYSWSRIDGISLSFQLGLLFNILNKKNLIYISTKILYRFYFLRKTKNCNARSSNLVTVKKRMMMNSETKQTKNNANMKRFINFLVFHPDSKRFIESRFRKSEKFLIVCEYDELWKPNWCMFVSLPIIQFILNRMFTQI